MLCLMLCTSKSYYLSSSASYFYVVFLFCLSFDVYYYIVFNDIAIWDSIYAHIFSTSIIIYIYIYIFFLLIYILVNGTINVSLLLNIYG